MKTSRRNARKRAVSGSDAIGLLKADHRLVKGWFARFDRTRSAPQKLQLAQKICQALKVHTTIEHEIFYPAFLEATGATDTHHEAEVEHQAATRLVGEIEASEPKDEYYDAKVTVLSEMIKHHIKEEEGPGGMFAQARKSEMDLKALGAELKSRKQELMERGTRQRTNAGAVSSSVHA
jgi:hypothetical protein